MTTLAQKKCTPCEGGVPPLSPHEIGELLPKLDKWAVEQAHHLRKAYTFPDFAQALAFVNKVGDIAEQEAHHPEIQLGWGKVVIEIWTHKVDGLTESDFILAAKIDSLES